jgi:hypothetical protein
MQCSIGACSCQAALSAPNYLIFVGGLHPALAAAHLAASRIDSLTWLRRLFDRLNTGAVARFAFDFVF